MAQTTAAQEFDKQGGEEGRGAGWGEGNPPCFPPLSWTANPSVVSSSFRAMSKQGKLCEILIVCRLQQHSRDLGVWVSWQFYDPVKTF